LRKNAYAELTAHRRRLAGSASFAYRLFLLFFSWIYFLAFLIPPKSANMALIFSASICLELRPSYLASFCSFR
jgi:hypothetical protein